MRTTIRFAPGVGLVALLLWPISEHWINNWIFKVFDLGHLVVFAGLVVWLERTWRIGAWRSVGLAMILAATIEWAQGWLGRSSELADLARSIIGVALGVLFVHPKFGSCSGWRRLSQVGIALALLAWPIGDAGPFLVDVYQAHRDFPVLADFGTRWQVRRWQLDQATIARTREPSDVGRWAGQLVFLSGPRPVCDAALWPAVMDWTGYRQLCWEFSVEGEPIEITFFVADDRLIQSPPERFEVTKRFPAGRHIECFDLERIRQAPRSSALDLARVETTRMRVPQPPSARTIRLHRIWLH